MDNSLSDRVIGSPWTEPATARTARPRVGSFARVTMADSNGGRTRATFHTPSETPPSGSRGAALAYLRDTFGPEVAGLPLPLFFDVDSRQIRFVQRMIERQIQTVETSSCGRPF